MKAVIITDTHFGARSDSLAFNEYFLRFFEEVFFPYIKENDITHVIHLGDVFDRRKYVNYHILSDVKKRVFDRLSDLGVNVDIIIGNHDTYWKNTNDVNSPSLLLSEYSNIKIYDKATDVVINGAKVLYVPWITDENQEETLETIKNTDSQICMGHLELNDFQVMPGVYHDGGLSPKTFEKFDLVLSGHFHTRQYKDNIKYLGCVAQINFSDLDETKGFHTIELDTGEMEFIENPFNMFHKILYDDANKKFNEAVGNIDFTKYENGHVKVVIVNKTNTSWFERFMERLNAVNPLDVKIFEDYAATFDIDAPTDVDMLVNDTLVVLDQSIDALTAEVDKDELKLLVKEIYIEAQNVEL